ncbi:MAG: hypothetical protein U0Q16_20285 [Bryobacteraceae bacterium]
MKELVRTRFVPCIWWLTWLLIWAAFVSIPSRVLGFRDWRLIAIGTFVLVIVMRVAEAPFLAQLARQSVEWLEPRRGKLVVLAAVIGLAIRLGWALALPTPPVSDGVEYQGLATRLAATGEYSSLVPTPGEPSSFTKWYVYRAPGYPMFLAACFLVFGHGAWLPMAANLALFLVTLYALYRLVATIAGYGCAVGAAWMLALWPGGIAFTGLLAYEPLFLCLVIVSLRLAIASRRGGLGTMAAAGLVAGMAVLVRPTAVAICPLWFLYHLLTAPDQRPRDGWWPAVRTAGLKTAAGVALMAAVVLPWTWRNYQHGFHVLVSANGSTALHLVANPRATVEYNEEMTVALRKEVGYDEHRYYEEASNRAIAWIRDNPGKYLAMAVQRQVTLLGEDGDGWYWSLKVGAGLGDSKAYILFQAVGHIWWAGLWLLTALGLVRGKALFLSTPALQVVAGAILAWWLPGLPFCQAARYHMVAAPLLMALASLSIYPVPKLEVIRRPGTESVSKAA